jgi:DNA-binding transcriptional ArsR family regulator
MSSGIRSPLSHWAPVADEMRALGHPVRLWAVSELARGPLSPSRLRAELQDPSLDVRAFAYHVHILRRAGLVVQVDRRAVRGAVEHVYALTERGTGVAAELERLRKVFGREAGS